VNKMNIQALYKKAEEEREEVQRLFFSFRKNWWIREIKKTIKTFPKGYDLRVPRDLLESLITFCDNEGLPVHKIGETTLSLARTYRNLVIREEQR